MNGNHTNVTADGISELVRGNEQQLLDEVTPLVQRQSVTLDLGRVERIDAAGISALITLYATAWESGHGFAVSNVSGHVAQILTLVGLDRILVSQNAVDFSHPGACLDRSAA